MIKAKRDKAALGFCGPHMWNKPPEYLRSASTVNSF